MAIEDHHFAASAHWNEYERAADLIRRKDMTLVGPCIKQIMEMIQAASHTSIVNPRRMPAATRQLYGRRINKWVKHGT